MGETIGKVAIIGAGQIGTSLTMAVLEKNPQTEIVAVDNNPTVAEDFWSTLKKNGFDDRDLNRVTWTTEACYVEGADLIVLATPISAFGNAVQEVREFVAPAAIWTDIGSVKELSIARIDERLPVGAHYVPSHLLNGNAGSGPRTADKSLFQGKPMIVVPGHAPQQDELKVQAFWESLGSIVTKMPAVTHDAMLGTMSHLEHVIVFSLMLSPPMQTFLAQETVTDPGNWIQALTRIGDAGPDMWVAIFRDNRDQILETAKHFRLFLEEAPTDGQMDSLNAYARPLPSLRVVPNGSNAFVGYDASLSALVARVSLAITANVQRVEQATGQRVAPIANPSLKDGLAPTGMAIESVRHLLTGYRETLPALVRDYLASFDATVRAIEKGDEQTLADLVVRCRDKRREMTQIFAGPTLPPTATSACQALSCRNG
jgi:cyclohexadieny/prephenate dehydrogenase